MSRDEKFLDINFQTDPPDDWDSFVMSCEPSHFEQTSSWANVESEDGWGARYIAAREGGGIVAGAMALVRRLSKIGRVGYVFRGPLIFPGLRNAALVRCSLAKALKDFARIEKLVTLVVVPAYDGAVLASEFIAEGFLRHPPMLPPAGLPPATLTLDLRQGIGSVEQSYRRSLRQEIRRASKKGVVVKAGTVADIKKFWSRHLELCRRRGVTSNVPGFGYVRRAWQELHERGRAWMFNATLEGEILSSLICLTAGHWFYAWRIGWAASSEKVYPTQAVFAQAIRTAAEAGFHCFDFMEIHPEEAARIERREKQNTKTSGVTFFKLGFGGNVRTLPPTLNWFPNAALRLTMKISGPALSSSAIFMKVIRLLTLRTKPST
jgi:lipid II:glycine glycyltransferase (peptidoglycan interpeptide bridge formation enzyme)